MSLTHWLENVAKQLLQRKAEVYNLILHDEVDSSAAPT